jgi:hypothetical protein
MYNYSTCCYTKEFPMYFLLQFYFLYIFFCILRFYWSYYGGYTQVVSFFKYRQCLIILPSVQTRIHAFSAPASRLRVQCTNYYLCVAAWLIRGEAHQYIDYVICFIQQSSYNLTRLRLRHYVILALGHVFQHYIILVF